jgi:hypothetical protein
MKIVALLFSLLFGWNSPEQIHLSWTENAGEMCVTWATRADTLFTSYVAWRLAGSTEEWTYAEASYRPINADRDFTRMVYIYSADMTALESDKRYEYSVGHTAFWS